MILISTICLIIAVAAGLGVFIYARRAERLLEKPNTDAVAWLRNGEEGRGPWGNGV